MQLTLKERNPVPSSFRVGYVHSFSVFCTDLSLLPKLFIYTSMKLWIFISQLGLQSKLLYVVAQLVPAVATANSFGWFSHTFDNIPITVGFFVFLFFYFLALFYFLELVISPAVIYPVFCFCFFLGTVLETRVWALCFYSFFHWFVHSCASTTCQYRGLLVYSNTWLPFSSPCPHCCFSFLVFPAFLYVIPCLVFI